MDNLHSNPRKIDISQMESLINIVCQSQSFFFFCDGCCCSIVIEKQKTKNQKKIKLRLPHSCNSK